MAALQRSTDDARPRPMQAAHHRLHDGLGGFARGTVPPSLRVEFPFHLLLCVVQTLVDDPAEKLILVGEALVEGADRDAGCAGQLGDRNLLMRLFRPATGGRLDGVGRFADPAGLF